MTSHLLTSSTNDFNSSLCPRELTCRLIMQLRLPPTFSFSCNKKKTKETRNSGTEPVPSNQENPHRRKKKINIPRTTELNSSSSAWPYGKGTGFLSSRWPFFGGEFFPRDPGSFAYSAHVTAKEFRFLAEYDCKFRRTKTSCLFACILHGRGLTLDQDLSGPIESRTQPRPMPSFYSFFSLFRIYTCIYVMCLFVILPMLPFSFQCNVKQNSLSFLFPLCFF